MTIVALGAGRMGSQIAAEYALAGHDVEIVTREPARAGERLRTALAIAETHGLATSAGCADAHARIRCVAIDAVSGQAELVVESVAEDLGLKAELLGRLARAIPDATIATNTSSLSITEIGAASGAGERVLGTHYWNPPLLMPLVEVVRGRDTEPGRVRAVIELLNAAGKRPVVVERDVAGFIWNRLQFALLREALWLVDEGVATPEAVDEIVRDGLARRWRLTGPFETAALGGAATFATVAANLFPELSTATTAEQLPAWTTADAGRLDALAERRDRELAAELRRDRGQPDRSSPG